ncbi:AMSH-like ubiquitin thioesterase 3 [Bienertia sinuspersici]
MNLQPSTPAKSIDVNTLTKKIDVDNRLSLGYYFRIADTLLKQKLVEVIDELETLKPEFQRLVDEHNKACTEMQQKQSNGREMTSYGSETSLPLPSVCAPSSETEQADTS